MNKIIGGLLGVMMSTSVMAADMYVTGSAGTAMAGRGDTNVGLAVGVELGKNLRVESAYTYDVDNKENTLFGHFVPQARIPGTTLTPYVLVGVGVNFDQMNEKPLWAVGGGLRVEISKSLDVDFRYRLTDNMDKNDRRGYVSAGLSYKF